MMSQFLLYIVVDNLPHFLDRVTWKNV